MLSAMLSASKSPHPIPRAWAWHSRPEAFEACTPSPLTATLTSSLPGTADPSCHVLSSTTGLCSLCVPAAYSKFAQFISLNSLATSNRSRLLHDLLLPKSPPNRHESRHDASPSYLPPSVHLVFAFFPNLPRLNGSQL